MFQGHTIQVQHLGQGVVELCFDRLGDAINKLDARTVDELRRATIEIAGTPQVRGVLVTSAKNVFIVGADITEFGALFKLDVPELAASIARSNEVFNAFEDLAVPTVVAINGFALGGGLEMALCGGYRVMSSQAQVGVPEVKLGLFPGFGGTVRLPRLSNAGIGVDWITSGKPQDAAAALQAGVVDEIAESTQLREAALALLQRAIDGELDWRARNQRKCSALPQSAAECATLFVEWKPRVAKSSGKHQPAAMSALELIERAAGMDRAAALREESFTFAHIAKTQAADALVQTFLSDQVLKKLYKEYARQVCPLKQGAVLGAGIMGGGIACTSAMRGVPVLLKDIAQAQLDLGMGEVAKLLARQVKSGRMRAEKAAVVHASILPVLDYAKFEQADVVIEAIVENLGVKHQVLGELEGVVRSDAVIASNTSSLRIDDIAQPLKRPENFVGMHFFNPVPRMPLVEVIRGSRTSDKAVSTAVGYAVAMGKTPIVVKDCPGFLVNRILTAYMRGFIQLIADGADFERIDQVMEAFGWAMGPAYLQDVVGMDTSSHVNDVISAGYPDRMPDMENDVLRLMADNRRYGQKNGTGFYSYEADPSGKPKRSIAADTRTLLATIQPNGLHAFSDQEIVERMMLPLLIEAAYALEDGVVASAVELDMALLLGIGFPAYLGGALKYADWLGLDHVVARADSYLSLGVGYHVTTRMRAMAASGERYYG